MLRKLILFFIGLQLLLAAAMLLRGDVFFHTDIARDFLLIEDMVNTHRPTLIGPHSGGISGLFHGPLWLYLNLPPFLVLQGNPVAMGWFWLGLITLSLFIFYKVIRGWYPAIPSFLGTLLYASTTPPYANNLFNPYGAVILSPLIFLFWYRYHLNRRYLDLAMTFLMLGLTFQFQMAFAGPLILLLGFYLLYIYKFKPPFVHLTAFFWLIPPLSTFILFDLRHDFLQVRALLNYLSLPPSADFKLITFLIKRLQVLFQSGWSLLPSVWGILLTPLIIFGLIAGRRAKTLTPIQFYLFLYLYLGYWLITLVFKGELWSYYTWPFQPLTIIALLSLLPLFKSKKIAYLILGGFIVLNTLNNFRHLASLPQFNGIDAGSWAFNYQTARLALNHQGEVGYFVYSADQFGYPLSYALKYVARQNPTSSLTPFTKKPVTLLFMGADDPNNPYTSRDYWKSHRVNLARPANKTEVLPNGTLVETYYLSPEEQQTPIDPVILTGLHFR